MADIQAFRAFRYDLGRVGALSDVIAPPYDVIDPVLQQSLYGRSPYNVIRLILNKEETTDTETENRYSRAAACLRDWLQDSVLKQDSARSLYVYHQDFEVEGRKYTRKGFLGRVRLERFGEGRIFPHEETLSGPKADRLKLFRATNMNLSPIFGLFPDEEGEVQKTLDTAVGRGLPLAATDHLGVVSKLWPVIDHHAISAVTGLMSSKPIFIADGHHRYETGLRYRDELEEAGQLSGPDAPANFILMMLVSMSDPGLVILPTHRLIGGLPDLSSDRLKGLLAEQFQVEVVGQGEKGARDAWELIETDGSQELLGFGTVADGTWHTARLRSPRLMASLAADHTPAWQGLGVSVLHVLVLGKLVREALGTMGECRYVHLLQEVLDAVAARQCQVAVFVPPASMGHVEKIAGSLEKMPPKSTYFYPKLLSGLVLNPLKSS